MPHVGAVAILDLDPDLAEGLAEPERGEAVRRLMVPVLDLSAGAWQPAELGRRSVDAVGVVVVSGLMIRSVELAGRTTSELVGVGDVLRPWEVEEGVPPVPFEVRWNVLTRTRLAILDRRFVAAAARWPSVVAQIAQRAVKRSRSLSLQLALGQVPRVEGRLLLLFWRLADRWGRMTPEGILVPLRLTHEALAGLVAARRPSVTSALGRLADAGLLRRVESGWLLDRTVEERLGEFLVTQETRLSSERTSGASIA
jgi:CRP/FNR family cyclic AMP-dependent transcriptional regulator